MNINIIEKTSVIYKVDNSLKLDKVFDINALVQVDYGKVTSVSSINIIKDGVNLGNCTLSGGSLNGYFYGNEDYTNSEIVNAVEDFIKDVELDLNENDNVINE